MSIYNPQNFFWRSDFSDIFGADRGRDFINVHQFSSMVHQFLSIFMQTGKVPPRAGSCSHRWRAFDAIPSPATAPTLPESPTPAVAGPTGPGELGKPPPSGERPQNHQKTCFLVDIPACTFVIGISRAPIRDWPILKSEPVLATKSSAARSPRQKASPGGSEGSIVPWQSLPVRGAVGPRGKSSRF